jgi:hypothetical protein
MPATDPRTCEHPTTSVVSSREIKAKGRIFIMQTLRCVDCGEICETNTF